MRLQQKPQVVVSLSLAPWAQLASICYIGTSSCGVAVMPNRVIHSDPEILSGAPVFIGTRVPAQSLFEYLEGGETLDEFLRQFPSVRRDQAVAALDLARATLLAGAGPSSRHAPGGP